MPNRPDPPLGVDAIRGPGTVPPDSPDDREDVERVALRRQQMQDDLTHRQKMGELLRESFGQDIAERKRYANKVFGLVAVWLAMLFLLLFACAVRRAPWRFELSDRVLIAVVAGTTVDVIGLFAVVANYLFFNPDRAIRRASRLVGNGPAAKRVARASKR